MGSTKEYNERFWTNPASYTTSYLLFHKPCKLAQQNLPGTVDKVMTIYKRRSQMDPCS